MVGILGLRLGRRIRDPDVNHHLPCALEHLDMVLPVFTRDGGPALRTQGWVPGQILFLGHRPSNLAAITSQCPPCRDARGLSNPHCLPRVSVEGFLGWDFSMITHCELAFAKPRKSCRELPGTFSSAVSPGGDHWASQ